MITRVLISIVLIGLFVGCSPCKKLQRKCPPQIIKERYDSISIKDSLIYKDRDVPFYLPADTEYIDKPIPFKEYISPVKAENDYAIAMAWIENSRLKLLLTQKEQIINFRIDSAIQIAKHWEYRWTNEKQKEIVKERYVPKIYKFALFFTVSAIILFGLWLYIKIRKSGLKTIFSTLFKK